MRTNALIIAVLTGANLCGWTSISFGGAYPIAGLDPSQRPEGAPQIQKVVKPSGWYTRALTGVEQPYPNSLRFLEYQGNWYTPFTRPGMHGRYDIRGWHRQ